MNPRTKRKFGNWPSSLIHHVLKVLRFGGNSQILQANLVFPRDCRLFIIGPSRQRMGAKLRSEKNSFCLSVHRRLKELKFRDNECNKSQSKLITFQERSQIKPVLQNQFLTLYCQLVKCQSKLCFDIWTIDYVAASYSHLVNPKVCRKVIILMAVFLDPFLQIANLRQKAVYFLSLSR